LSEGRTRAKFLHLMSTAVVNQALLSAASLAVGLVLLRHSSDLHYGYYVLGTTALMLMTGLQGAYISAPMVNRLTHGDLYREQRIMLRKGAAVVVVAAAVLWAAGVLDRHTGALVIATALAGIATLNREFFRAVLLAYRRPADVLRADIGYVAALVGTVIIAVQTPSPGVAAILGMGCAAVVGGGLLQRRLVRHEAYNLAGSPGILREIAPVGGWSTLGSGIHWAFNQGYSYLIAGTLGVPAVAAVSATRLLMMPVNLLSTGMGSVMMPLAARWLHDRGPASVMRRLAAITLGLASLSLVYFGVMWLLRDFIFGELLHKHFPERDQLLKLWVCVFLLILCRDQMIWLLAVRERFRPLAALTAVSAAVALSVSYFAMLRLGVSGALVGILAGEVLQVAGIVTLSLREARTPRSPPA
jgi:O-antigen/teichoic acid export membrane protein